MRHQVVFGGSGRGARAAGFTLIELLVVISIIALLVAMLLPTLGKAREQARQLACANNAQIIAKGLTQYIGDWGVYPFNRYTYDPVHRFDHKWQALGCLSRYIGGSKEGLKGTADMRWLDEDQIPGACVCPSANLGAIYAYEVNYKYYACYWTNIAIRCNRGFGPLFSAAGRPGDDHKSDGPARFSGRVCPNYPGDTSHWRSVYHPSLETVLNPAGMVFSGDTRDTEYSPPNASHETDPGDWRLSPGSTAVQGHLGFGRHGGKIMLGYADGHARAFSEEEMWSHMYVDLGGGTRETHGDWMVNYIGEDGCGGSKIHRLPPAVLE